MRDPARIDPFLAKLGELWRQYPDYRFGQLVMNLTRDDRGAISDPWDWEESDWEAAIRDYDAPELTDEQIRARVEEILRMMNE